MAQLAFEYLEIRPCLEVNGETVSFMDERSFDIERSRLEAAGVTAPVMWSIYGRYTDEAGQLLARAIGDFTEKADAFTVMNAILAPMAKARDYLLTASHNFDVDNEADRQTYASYVEDATDTLTDFINQSSNHERL